MTPCSLINVRVECGVNIFPVRFMRSRISTIYVRAHILSPPQPLPLYLLITPQHALQQLCRCCLSFLLQIYSSSLISESWFLHFRLFSFFCFISSSWQQQWSRGGWYKCGCLPGKWADLSAPRGDIGSSSIWLNSWKIHLRQICFGRIRFMKNTLFKTGIFVSSEGRS